jgi:hypothetical protein
MCHVFQLRRSRRFDAGWVATNVFAVYIACFLASTAAHATTLVHYDFDNGSGTTVSDKSGLGNHGTLTNFADTTAGVGIYDESEGWVNGGGLSMLENGLRSYVETSLALNSVAGSDFTIEYLASADQPNGWSPAVASNTASFGDGENVLFTGISINGIGYELRMPDGAAPGATNAAQPVQHPWIKGPSPPDSTSHHIAMTYSLGTDQVELFVDGVSQGTHLTNFGLDPTIASSNTKFRIGNVGFDSGQQWGGVISGVAISSQSLGPGSFALVNGNQSSTLLHYDFSDNGGTTVTNLAATGAANNGTLIGFGDTSAGTGSFDTTEGWVAGGGLSFLDDAVRSYVDTPLSINSLTDDFTIEATVNYGTNEGFSPIVGSSHGPFFSPNEISFLGIDATQRYLAVNMPGTWSNNQFEEHPWYNPPGGTGESVHHVAIVFHEATGDADIVFDGEVVSTVALPDTDMNSTALFRLGNIGYSPEDEWDGIFYGFAVSDEALTASNFVLQIPIPLIGDYDRNGLVEEADYNLWKSMFGSNVTPGVGADGNGDGVIDAADYTVWRDHLGTSQSGFASIVLPQSVPEPSSAIVLIAGLGCFVVMGARGLSVSAF